MSLSATADLPGANGLTYDASGHLTGLNGLTLSYDCWGRLVQVANTPSGTVSYLYDSSGRRVRKQAGSVKTYYLYDGNDLLAETDGTGHIVRSYVWGAMGLISDHAPPANNLPNAFSLNMGRNAPSEMLAPLFDLPYTRGSLAALCQGGNGTDRLYSYDAQGNLGALLDGGNGSILGHNCYSPFGSAELAQQLQQSGFGYKAQEGVYRDNEAPMVAWAAKPMCLLRLRTRLPCPTPMEAQRLTRQWAATRSAMILTMMMAASALPAVAWMPFDAAGAVRTDGRCGASS